MKDIPKNDDITNVSLLDKPISRRDFLKYSLVSISALCSPFLSMRKVNALTNEDKQETPYVEISHNIGSYIFYYNPYSHDSRYPYKKSLTIHLCNNIPL